MPGRGNGGSPIRAPRSEPTPGHEEHEQPGAHTTAPRGRPPRRLLIGALALVVVVALVAWWLHAQGYQDTDDAQVNADIVAVSPRVAGTVTAVHVVDNQAVKAGEVLVELDPTDLQVAVAQARTEVAQA